MTSVRGSPNRSRGAITPPAPDRKESFMTTTDRPRVWGYARVSTDEQFTTRLSIDEQQRQIRDFCVKRGFDLGPDDCRLCEEPVSAYKVPFLDREVGRAIDDQLQRGDHLVIAKVDRAFRNMDDAFHCVRIWDQRGIVVHILDLPTAGNPVFDRLLLAILAWVAEWESARKSERQCEAN